MKGAIEEVVRLLDEAKDKVLHLEMTRKRPDAGVVIVETLCGCRRIMNEGGLTLLKDHIHIALNFKDVSTPARYRIFTYDHYDYAADAHIYMEEA